MSRLTKSETVLQRQGEGPNGSIEFASVDGSGRTEGPIVGLPPERWVDMGSPDEITVTIEAGDRLNDG